MDDCIPRINEWISDLIVKDWTHDDEGFTFIIVGSKDSD